MRQSKNGIKIRKEDPTNEDAKNAKLLIKAGYIQKELSGVYNFLPFGLISIEKIISIIREEMNSLGAQETLFSTLQNLDLWKRTNRYEEKTNEEFKEDVWFFTKGRDKLYGLGWTHEEAFTNMMSHNINSYRDLPIYLYQFQNKFRNEERAKSGLLRTREFIMKDLYSFSKDLEEHNEFYEKIAQAYMNIFKKVGIGDMVYRTFASGGDFSEFSDEFQMVSQIGEDIIYIDKEKNIAINKEVYNDDVINKLGLDKDKLIEQKAVEVGNIFTLGTRFSKELGCFYKDKEGKEVPAFMGSYGIGPARLLGCIVETYSADNKLVLPKEIAPFKINLILLNESERELADKIYKELKDKNIDVLYDDREEKQFSVGEKLKDADMLGVPFQVIVSSRNTKDNSVELEDKIKNEKKMINIDNIIDVCINI